MLWLSDRGAVRSWARIGTLCAVVALAVRPSQAASVPLGESGPYPQQAEGQVMHAPDLAIEQDDDVAPPREDLFSFDFPMHMPVDHNVALDASAMDAEASRGAVGDAFLTGLLRGDPSLHADVGDADETQGADERTSTVGTALNRSGRGIFRFASEATAIPLPPPVYLGLTGFIVVFSVRLVRRVLF